MRMLHVSVGDLREEGLTRETRRRTLGGVFGFQRCTPLPSGSRKRICLDRFGALPTLSHDPDARKAIPASVKLRWARCHQGERKEGQPPRRAGLPFAEEAPASTPVPAALLQPFTARPQGAQRTPSWRRLAAERAGYISPHQRYLHPVARASSLLAAGTSDGLNAL